MADLRAPKRMLRAIPKLAGLRGSTEKPISTVAPEDKDAIGAVTAPPAPSLRVGPLGRIVIGAGGTALFITCLYSAYGPASVGDMTATIVMLVSGWVFAVGAFTLSELLSSLSNRHRFFASSAFATVCAAVTVVWGATIFHAPSPAVQKSGARIFLEAKGFAKGSDVIEITLTNRGDSIARFKSQTGSSWSLQDHILSEQEEEQQYRLALDQLPHGGSGVEVLPNNGRTVNIEIKLSDAQYDSIISGAVHLYLFTVMSFTDELTPPGEKNIASLCTHFDKKTTVGLVCLGHNESRLKN